MRVAVLIAALAAAAVGCGTGASSTAATDGATRLTITYWPQGVAKQGLAKQGVAKPAAGTWTLRCAPAGGTLPGCGGRAAGSCGGGTSSGLLMALTVDRECACI